MVGAYIMVGLGVANMILVIVKSAAAPPEVEPDQDPEEEIQKMQNMLGRGLPSFFILNWSAVGACIQGYLSNKFE